MTKSVSECCGAELLLHDGNEGTCWYTCMKCEKPCNPTPTLSPTETVSDYKYKEEL